MSTQTTSSHSPLQPIGAAVVSYFQFFSAGYSFLAKREFTTCLGLIGAMTNCTLGTIPGNIFVIESQVRRKDSSLAENIASVVALLQFKDVFIVF